MTKIEIEIPDSIYKKAIKTYEIFECNLILKLEKMSVNYIQDTINEIISIL